MATDNCETQGSGYVTSPNWVRLGASALDGFCSSSIAQQVTIPAAPATLSFDLRILRTFDESASGEMLVSLDGTTVFGADNHAAGYTSYAPVVVDVSAFAGATRTLRFYGENEVLCPGGGGCTLTPESFDIDRISLQAPDPPGLPGDTKPPQTFIVKDPPAKSSKAKVKYKFESSEPDSSFECKFDKRPFKACNSPRRLKVEDGKHKFEVRAIDMAGNVDNSPAQGQVQDRRLVAPDSRGAS